MRGQTAGDRADRPAVVVLRHTRRRLGDDRLERDHQTFLQFAGREWTEEIRNRWLLVEAASDAMSAHVVDYGVSPSMDLTLDGAPQLRDAHAGFRGLQSLLERRPRALREVV